MKLELTHRFETSLYVALLTIRKTTYMVALSAISKTDAVRILQMANYNKIVSFVNTNVEVDIIKLYRLSNTNEATDMFKQCFSDKLSVDFVINQISGYPIMERIKKSAISPNFELGAHDTRIWHVFEPSQRKKYYKRAHDIVKQVELALRFHCVVDTFVRGDYTFTKENSLALPLQASENRDHDSQLPGSVALSNSGESTYNVFVLYTPDLISLKDQLHDIYASIPPKTDARHNSFQFYFASPENCLIYKVCADETLEFVPIQQVII